MLFLKRSFLTFLICFYINYNFIMLLTFTIHSYINIKTSPIPTTCLPNPLGFLMKMSGLWLEASSSAPLNKRIGSTIASRRRDLKSLATIGNFFGGIFYTPNFHHLCTYLLLGTSPQKPTVCRID